MRSIPMLIRGIVLIFLAYGVTLFLAMTVYGNAAFAGSSVADMFLLSLVMMALPYLVGGSALFLYGVRSWRVAYFTEGSVDVVATISAEVLPYFTWAYIVLGVPVSLIALFVGAQLAEKMGKVRSVTRMS